MQAQTAPDQHQRKRTTKCYGSTSTSCSTRTGAQAYQQQSARRYCGMADNGHTPRQINTGSEGVKRKSTSVPCNTTEKGSTHDVYGSILSHHRQHHQHNRPSTPKKKRRQSTSGGGRSRQAPDRSCPPSPRQQCGGCRRPRPTAPPPPTSRPSLCPGVPPPFPLQKEKPRTRAHPP